MNNSKIIARLSFIAGLLILAMFFVTLATGVSQEKFEISQTVESYTQNLIAAQNPLRLIFTIDLVFITVFTTLFVILPSALKTGEKVTDAIANVALGAMVLCGLLDFYEDLHILTMLHNAVKNLPIEQSEISLQMTASMFKFCLSYLSLFLLAFILPNRTFAEKILKYSLWFVQLPVGVLVYTAPENLHLLFNLIRFAFMISGFFLLAFIFRENAETK
ncbi:MAG TPA: hypothetical protein PKE69_17465 [Pyrinomonadaceae bacterium]|nr:hypothetical protein [Pyrinomonadaceae bacterium]